MRKGRATGAQTPASVLASVRQMELASAYVLTGEDTLAVERIIAALRGAVLTPETEEFNYEVLDAETEGVTCAEILGAIETVPFLGGRRLVVVKHCDALPASELEVLGERIAKLVKEGREDVVVVVTCRELDKRTKFAKQAMASGVVVECVAGVTEDPAVAARERFEKRMTRGAAAMLNELCGGDARALANEVEKVCLYVGDRDEVREEDVLAVCVDTALRNEWEIADCLLRGEVGRALHVLRDMREGGADPVYECTIVASAISRLPAARAAARDGTLYQRWHEFRLSYRNPAHRGAEERLRRLSERKLAAALRWLMYMDIAIKGTNLPGEVLADLTSVCVV